MYAFVHLLASHHEGKYDDDDNDDERLSTVAVSLHIFPSPLHPTTYSFHSQRSGPLYLVLHFPIKFFSMMTKLLCFHGPIGFPSIPKLSYFQMQNRVT